MAVHDLNGTNSTIEDVDETLAEQVSRQALELAVFAREIALLQDKVEELAVKEKEARDESLRVSEEMKAVYASASWRISAPLRFLSSLAKK